MAHGTARVHMVPAASDNISWLIEYAPGHVALIDGPSLKPVITYCISHQLMLTHIINTHIHADHIGVNYGLPHAQEAHPDVCSNSVEVWGSERTADAIPYLTRALTDGEYLTLGELQGLVWLTEGHINGHISLIFWSMEDGRTPQKGSAAALFCGDTMFAAGCGRLFDGPAETMYASLQRLCTLPSDTLVFPAHEYTLDNLNFAHYALPQHQAIEERLDQCKHIRSEGRSTLPSTIGLERATNPFVQVADVTSFAELRSLKDQGVHRR